MPVSDLCAKELVECDVDFKMKRTNLGSVSGLSLKNYAVAFATIFNLAFFTFSMAKTSSVGCLNVMRVKVQVAVATFYILFRFSEIFVVIVLGS